MEEDKLSLRLSGDGDLVMHNLKSSAYQLILCPFDGEVIGVASSGNLVFASVARQGMQVYRVDGNDVKYVTHLGRPGASCYDVTTDTKHVAYISDDSSGVLSVCVHSTSSLVDDDDDNDVTRPLISHVIRRPAPLALHSSLGQLFIGGAAWTSSWTSTSSDNDVHFKGVDEKCVVAIRVQSSENLHPVTWQAVEHSVFMMQAQTHQLQTLLAVADSRSGIMVYDVGGSKLDRQPPSRKFECLYRIDVEHVRSFRLVGACVAVFHRFEPNVSFWNVAEQRTILCINVQDQTRQLSEELDDIDDYVIPSSDDEDHVTSVTGLPIDGGSDHLLVYGTISGCIFGMSVRRRTTVFSIPCPLPLDQLRSSSSSGFGSPGALRAIAILPTGQIVLAYDGFAGLTAMNFNVNNPPDRPPTRCQKRVVT